MNKDTRSTIDICEKWLKENLLACQFYYTYESCIFMGEVRGKLDCGTIV